MVLNAMRLMCVSLDKVALRFAPWPRFHNLAAAPSKMGIKIEMFGLTQKETADTIEGP